MSHDTPSILVVDDDVDTCNNLRDILTDQGYHVDTAHDGPSALALGARRHYDVALLDLRMPGMDGLTLYREIKKVSAGTVAIIVTAYATGNTIEDAGAAGVWQVLSKPVDLKQLLGLVDSALGQPLVLVVDDDPGLCANLWDLLQERKYRVFLAHGTNAAGATLAKRSFDVVLIDMKLEQGDGGQVFNLVRQTNPQARTIVITGYQSEMEQRVRRLLDEGASAACYKPFDVPQLLATLERLALQESRGA